MAQVIGFHDHVLPILGWVGAAGLVVAVLVLAFIWWLEG